VYIHCLSHRVTSWRFFAMFSCAAAACSKDASIALSSLAFSHFRSVPQQFFQAS
jgi:hypothetical protein